MKAEQCTLVGFEENVGKPSLTSLLLLLFFWLIIFVCNHNEFDKLTSARFNTYITLSFLFFHYFFLFNILLFQLKCTHTQSHYIALFTYYSWMNCRIFVLISQIRHFTCTFFALDFYTSEQENDSPFWMNVRRNGKFVWSVHRLIGIIVTEID